MACISSPELTDRQLMTFVDSEADPEIVAHLEQCAHCDEKAQRLAQLQRQLASQLYRLTCPSPAELGEYHLGFLPATEASVVGQHLTTCPHCAREIAQLQDFLIELAPELEFSPLERVKVLVARLVQRGSEPDRWAGPSPTPIPVGIRGAEEEIYVYQVDDAQIVIEIQDDPEAPDHKVLIGLVAGLEPHGLQAQLWQTDHLVAAAPVDDLGNFVLSHLPPGHFELILSRPDLEIHLQMLEI